MNFLRRYQILIFFIVSSLILFGLLTYFLPFLNAVSDNNRQTISLVFLVGTFGFSMLIFFIAFRWSLRPFRQMADEANQLAKLENSPKYKSETDFMLDSFQGVLGRLQQQQNELEKLNRKVEKRAESAEKFNERVVASLPSGLITFDLNGVTTTLNAPAYDILTIDKNLRKIHYRVLFEKIPALAEMVENCLKSGKTFQRQHIVSKAINGKIKKLGATIAPIDSVQGGVLCLLTDISEVSQLREQIALKRNLASLGEMSAGIAHEFKNSLAALQSYAQLFQRLETSDQTKIIADELLNEVKNLSDLTTSFLDFARPKPLNLSETSLQILFEECAEELKNVFLESQVSIRLRGNFETIQADERMLKQALLNLLRNAAEAISMEQKHRFVTVSAKKDDEFAVIEIEDTGNGIAEEDLANIFVPFFTTKAKGHGIGLALAHRVITQHNGILTASNSKNGGAIFTVKLPISPNTDLNNNNFLNVD